MGELLLQGMPEPESEAEFFMIIFCFHPEPTFTKNRLLNPMAPINYVTILGKRGEEEGGR